MNPEIELREHQKNAVAHIPVSYTHLDVYKRQHYNLKFYIPDGGKIRITFRDGHTADRVCKYIDDRRKHYKKHIK